MLLLLSAGLLVGSLLVLVSKKNRESLLLSGMCLSLTLFLAGVMILIAKKGGISRELEVFLFFSHSLRLWIQYRFITLGQLGYLIAIGRHLFPLFLLEMAMCYSMLPAVRKHPMLRRLATVLPIVTLILYCPPLYRLLEPIGQGFRTGLYYFSYCWVVGYVVLALVLLLIEFFSITMSFCRQQYFQILVCLAALSTLFLLYCGQDPSQVYRFYSYDYLWIKGVGYLQYTPGLSGYIVLVVGNLICGGLGLVSLLRFTQDNLTQDRNEVVLERKFDVARTGASVFVHSIKNQLLANRVLHKRIRAELEREAPDLDKVRAWAGSLCDNNEQLISRSEELYRTVKAKSVRLVPTSLGRLAELSASRFHHKYPEGRLLVEVDGEVQVLADENYLSEAIYNLLTNGWESNLLADNANCAVTLYSHMERLYTVLEVRDHGTGIPHAALKHICEPFYSSKNSNYNWGMGLYHVQTIIRSHLGSLRVENRAGDGASFYLLLPRYDQHDIKRRRQP